MALPQLSRPAVLAYHHVGPPGDNPDPGLTMAPGIFAEQMHWLSELEVSGVSVSHWLDNSPSRRSVVLTFDDAYADLCTHVFPVLREYGFGATVFVVTGLLGKTNRWDEAVNRTSYAIMSGAEIRNWAAEGVEFAAHTRTHPKLTELRDEQLEDEVVGCRNDLTTLLGQPPRAFAYPYGLVNRRTARLVGAHFDAAFTIKEGPNRAGADRMLLRRSGGLAVDSNTDMALRVSLGWTPRHRVRQRLRSSFGRVRRNLLHRG
jgi:peptidoglycan/xylan/chitin deacetylase (PgdA/CDA1 family)